MIFYTLVVYDVKVEFQQTKSPVGEPTSVHCHAEEPLECHGVRSYGDMTPFEIMKEQEDSRQNWQALLLSRGHRFLGFFQ